MFKYPISPNGVFPTIQGECSLLGVPMHFLRLAGCSVGCPGCDTDYTVAERLSVAEIVERLQRLWPCKWVWITGGEPTDHPLGELVAALRREGYRVALATSGVRDKCLKDDFPIREGRSDGGFDFVSVSPHFADERWVVRSGTQLNVVSGLNGFRLDRLPEFDWSRFGSKWVTPVWIGNGMVPSSVAECVEWVTQHQEWRVNVQAHKLWRLP